MQPKNNGYLAGILDGDGCISMNIQSHLYWVRGKSYSYVQAYLVISIFQTDERLMKWLMAHYGGSYNKVKPNAKNKLRKPGWRWLPSPGKLLENFLLTIIPHLVLKREQALLALEYVRLGPLKRGPGSNNKDVHAKRQELARRCSKLNQRESPEANTLNDSNEVESKIESELHSDMQSESVVTQNS